MEFYAGILLYVIPGFSALLVIEILYGHIRKNQTYRLMDTLSSLSSGITNILKDSLGIIFIIISYPFLVEILSIGEIESSLTIYITAFICIDFASYWGHRLSHKINLFWNKHVIHHSSEEFNLACALRQSISTIIGFRSIFLIPAAIIGLPAEIIITLTPLHLFAQFWYHTQHIGKLGFIEYIFVTPSQHRVHHAINSKYIDKNLSAIFCVWDRLFGTFQEELKDEPPVYGVLKPVRSWNPVWINFQHFFFLFKDAWYAKKWKDKFIIWFMPTGWRPKDVSIKFPIKILENIKNYKKYDPKYTNLLKFIAIFHFMSVNILLIYFLSNFKELNHTYRIVFGFMIFISVFGYTSLMDGYWWSRKFEIFRGLLFILIVMFIETYFNQINKELNIYLFFYGIATISLTIKSNNQIPLRYSYLDD